MSESVRGSPLVLAWGSRSELGSVYRLMQMVRQQMRMPR
jgi:hypothetical protein